MLFELNFMQQLEGTTLCDLRLICLQPTQYVLSWADANVCLVSHATQRQHNSAALKPYLVDQTCLAFA
jgi:hypothetical protein